MQKFLIILATFMLILLTACGSSSTSTNSGGQSKTSIEDETSGEVIQAKIGVISYLSGAGAAMERRLHKG